MHNSFDFTWPSPPNLSVWHIDENFSQIKKAVDDVKQIVKTKEKQIVRIAHLDTGYDSNHKSLNYSILRKDLERDFSKKTKANNSAIDPGSGPNGGHGTGTLSILSGTVSLNEKVEFIGITNDLNIEIVPIRISDKVVLFKNESFEKALEYIYHLYEDASTRCHIVTMSMGGSASKNWAFWINKLYEKGIIIISAGGNNFGRSTPRTLVYPARFNRVIAAVGVCYNFTPYYDERHDRDLKIMQGNYGPRELMRTAIAAFTPNLPWAVYNTNNETRFSGAGTSSATPQIALASALYYQKYFNEIESLKEGWQKVEAIKFALFSSASKKINREDINDLGLYFGNGVLQSAEMLKIRIDESTFTKEEEDKVAFPIWHLITEIITSEESYNQEDNEDLALEFSNILQNSGELQELFSHEELEEIELKTNYEKVLKIRSLINESPMASQELKKLFQ